MAVGPFRTDAQRRVSARKPKRVKPVQYSRVEIVDGVEVEYEPVFPSLLPKESNG